MPSFRLRALRWFLHNRAPLIGGFLRRIAAARLARRFDPERWALLSEALSGGSDPVQQAVHDALSHTEDPELIDHLCQEWLDSRSPTLEAIITSQSYIATSDPARLYTALKVGQREALLPLNAANCEALVLALTDPDEKIASAAYQLALEVPQGEQSTALANRIGYHWNHWRSPVLGQLIKEKPFLAELPVGAFIATRLKSGHLADLQDADPLQTELLLQVLHDSDAELRSAARTVLATLTREDSKERMAQSFLETGIETLGKVLQDQGYLPKDEADRALFLFLTEQWERYAIVDFDRRYLLGIYESANKALRQRIIEKLRASGRSDFLTILAGREYRSRIAEVSPGEAEVLIQMLLANEEWPRLWHLVFELPISSSARIMRQLARQPWRPDREDEKNTFSEMASIVAEDWEPDDETIASLPPIAQRARILVPGRVNDVAFAPNRPVIAVGTGRRRLILWNYQTAERERQERLERSCSHVAFTTDGSVLAVERGSPRRQSEIYFWRGSEHFTHRFSDKVTAVAPVGENQVVVALRNGKTHLFDLNERDHIHSCRFYKLWARDACVSPDGKEVGLLRKGIVLLRLEDFKGPPVYTWSRVVTAAAFTNREHEMLIGRTSGEVQKWQTDWAEPEQEPFTQHTARIQAIQLLFDQSVVLTASSDGELRFTSWPEGKLLESMKLEGERLTSLHISPCGDFMAIGSSDQSMSLWDLRAFMAPRALSEPFARALPFHLAAVSALASSTALTPPLQAALRFAVAVLRHRFRYDIEIAETKQIRFGEFDIELGG